MDITIISYVQEKLGNRVSKKKISVLTMSLSSSTLAMLGRATSAALTTFNTHCENLASPAGGGFTISEADVVIEVYY